MGRSGQRKQQQQQRGAGRRSHCISTTLDVCLTCLKGEEWCFAIGEVGHISPDQHPPLQKKEEPERPARMREDLHPPKRMTALSSEGVWDWLVEPGRDYEEALLCLSGSSPEGGSQCIQCPERGSPCIQRPEGGDRASSTQKGGAHSSRT
ncbi:UNVERIFIED_CONTAM: hypothetical protein FKN15_018061 [Acipenser sinensis]